MLYSKDKVSFAIFQKIAAKKLSKHLSDPSAQKWHNKDLIFCCVGRGGTVAIFFLLFGEKVRTNDYKVWFAGYT